MAMSRIPGLGNGTRLEDLTARKAQRPRGRGPQHLHRSETTEISDRAKSLRGHHLLLKALLGGPEEAVSGADEILEQAGKSEYLQSIESPDDLSPEATAGRILGGITGYIYGAFKLQNPEATAEDFERFKAQVQEGFERGLGQAKSTLEGLERLDDEMVSGIDRTETLVREGLDEFFAHEADRY
jgi:hypothetical protein